MRVDRLFNIKVMYTNTSFGQKFINYLRPVNLPIDVKKNILNENINIKKRLNYVLLSEINQCL